MEEKQKSVTECRLNDSLQPFRRCLKGSGAVGGAGTLGRQGPPTAAVGVGGGTRQLTGRLLRRPSPIT